jgi:hypothetical protein
VTYYDNNLIQGDVKRFSDGVKPHPLDNVSYTVDIYKPKRDDTTIDMLQQIRNAIKLANKSTARINIQEFVNLADMKTFTIKHNRSDDQHKFITYKTEDAEAWKTANNNEGYIFMQIPDFSGETLYTFNATYIDNDWIQGNVKRFSDGIRPFPLNNTLYEVKIYKPARDDTTLNMLQQIRNGLSVATDAKRIAYIASDKSNIMEIVDMDSMKEFNIKHHRSNASGLRFITYKTEDAEAWKTANNNEGYIFMQIPDFSGETLYRFNVTYYGNTWIRGNVRRFADGIMPVPLIDTFYNVKIYRPNTEFLTNTLPTLIQNNLDEINNIKASLDSFTLPNNKNKHNEAFETFCNIIPKHKKKSIIERFVDTFDTVQSLPKRIKDPLVIKLTNKVPKSMYGDLKRITNTMERYKKQSMR